MTQPEKSDIDSRLAGVLVQADSVSGDGETQSYGEFVITLDDGTVDIRLGDRKDTIWILPLEESAMTPSERSNSHKSITINIILTALARKFLETLE